MTTTYARLAEALQHTINALSVDGDDAYRQRVAAEAQKTLDACTPAAHVESLMAAIGLELMADMMEWGQQGDGIPEDCTGFWWAMHEFGEIHERYADDGTTTRRVKMPRRVHEILFRRREMRKAFRAERRGMGHPGNPFVRHEAQPDELDADAQELAGIVAREMGLPFFWDSYSFMRDGFRALAKELSKGAVAYTFRAATGTVPGGYDADLLPASPIQLDDVQIERAARVLAPLMCSGETFDNLRPSEQEHVRRDARAILAAGARRPPTCDDVVDAQRYRRLRVLGAAPSTSPQLEAGTVLCFTGLDQFVDADLAAHPSRGEPVASAQVLTVHRALAMPDVRAGVVAVRWTIMSEDGPAVCRLRYTSSGWQQAWEDDLFCADPNAGERAWSAFEASPEDLDAPCEIIPMLEGPAATVENPEAIGDPNQTPRVHIHNPHLRDLIRANGRIGRFSSTEDAGDAGED